MNKKQVLITAFISLLLFSALVGVQFVNLASANFIPEQPPQGIRIGSDGNVEGTDKIQRNGNVYTLTGNIYDTIVVLRDNIVIDGAGYALIGDGNSTGIFLQERNNVTVKNIEIRNFYYGIKLTWGWALDGSRNNNIFENTITNNTIGILLTLFSGNNFVSENTITNNEYGISIHYSKNNVFRNNQITHNTYNFWIDAELSSHMSDFVNDIDDSNTVDGKPIYYWVNEQDKTIPTDAGYVGLVNCTGITVQNLNLANNGQGVLLVSTNNSLITKNHIRNNGYGIAVYGPYVSCAYNSITENRVTENTGDGIYLWGGYDDAITKNYITNNQKNGIHSFDSRDVNIIGNNITANKEKGIKLWGYDSSNNVVSENYIANNENGITLDISSNNDIIGNTIIANKGWGIVLAYTGFPPFSNNTIYHNNFVNDQQAVYTVDDLLPPLPESPPIDIWDNGFEGNYWSNYNGTDSNGDGIGDTPYIIDADNQDNYPLMNPIVNPEFPDEDNPTTSPTDPSPTSQPSPSPPFIAMPEEYINYTICRVNGSLWAKVDGTYPLYVSYEKFGFDDVSKLDDTSLLVTSDELPMVYPTPPGTTNISVKMNETELNWSNYTKTHPEATHHTAIGDWPMINCTIHPVPDHFILKIHYEHPIILINGSYTFLYDLNISPYLSPWCNKSTAYFNIRLETNYTNLHVYTTGSNEAWNPLKYTITRGNTAETITLQIVSEYSKPLPGDLIISFTEDKTPESTNPGFLGTTLPIEYGYAIVAVIIVAVAAVASYLFLTRLRRRKQVFTIASRADSE